MEKHKNMSLDMLQKYHKHKGILKTLIIGILLGYIVSKLVTQNPSIALGAAAVSLPGTWLIARYLFKDKTRGVFSKTQLLFFIPLTFLYITAVPKIGTLPLSPVFFFLGIYILYALVSPKGSISSLRQSTKKLFLLLLICWLYQYIITADFSEMGTMIDMQAIEIVGIFCGVNCFVKNNGERAIWATRILALVLIISMAWFLAEVVYRDLALVRAFIYASVLQTYGTRALAEATVYPNGLSQLLFLFGYQVSVSVPLTIILFSIEKGKVWKIFWGIGCIVSLLAMICAAERSVMLAAASAVTFFLYSRKQIKFAVLLLALSLLTLFIFSHLEGSHEKHLMYRLQDEESGAEAFARLKLQLVGLVVIVKNPLGLTLTGRNWTDEVWSAGGNFDAWGGEETAVHNGYLGRVIPYGWIYGVLMAVVLLHLCKLIKKVSLFAKKNKERAQYAQAVSFSLIGVLIQACFHNASLFNFNAVSVTIALLLSVWVDILTNDSCPKMKHVEGVQ
ncbi:MAG: hypothetical protein HW406_56 [Candidatus Brocadiaceae bacterium]|nr:hypothetical protein [Candidatus Brocadiaceae bacterium]